MCSLRGAGFALTGVCLVLLTPPSARAQLRPHPAALDDAAPELIQKLQASPLAYFRFINRAWTERVCEAFADVKNPAIVRLHGDAHIEQFAMTKDAWGLDDFDDSTRGPAYVDIVRFLGSIDLAARQRGWEHERDALWDRFLAGYREGLSNPDHRPSEPDIVRELRKQAPVTPAAYLAWAEKRMQSMDAARFKSVLAGMEALDRLLRPERPDLAPGYFAVQRAGWLRIGVGSSGIRKVLIRVQGPTTDPADDVLIEAKEVSNLDGVRCLEKSPPPPAVRVIAGARQLSRLKHDILAVGPTLLIPAAADRAEHWLDWWVSSWEPSYREIGVNDLRSPRDLADIAFDAGVQLGAGNLVSVRQDALSSVGSLEARLRKETAAMVEELLSGWQEIRARHLP